MANEHYIVKKIGDKYVPVQQQNAGTCMIWTGTGAIVAGLGFLHGGVGGWISTLAGAGLIYRGVTGRNPLAKLFCSEGSAKTRLDHGPSYQRDFRGRAPQKPQDAVDESSMESFPASDPPAHTVST